jgi:hypothetical protein
VNANPSGSRRILAGGRDGPESRRENAVATGPLPSLVRADGRAGHAGLAHRRTRGSIGGTRHAKRVCRGALSARRAAQGRAGDRGLRHVVRHLESHLFLMANTSAPADAVRPLLPGDARSWSSAESTVHSPASPPKARPTDRSSPRLGARDTELVQPAHGAVATPSGRSSRGKGVLAV